MRGMLKDVKSFFGTIYQLKELVSKGQWWQAIGVFFLILVGTVFETLGIAAILPFIYAVMNPTELWDNKYVSHLCEIFHISTDSGLIIFMGIGISVVYIFKNLLLLFVAYIQARYKSALVYTLSKLMLHSYLKRPYVFFLNTNSAEMMRGVNEDVSSIGELVECLFKICSLSLQIMGIGLFLTVQNPTMAIGTILLAIVIFFFIMMTIKKKSKKVGILKRDLAAQAYQYVYQAIHGVKEIKIMNREEYFIKSYTNVTGRKKRADVVYSFISACPDRIAETSFIIGIMLIVCGQVATGKMSQSFIPSLAVFAVGAMRILPSLSTLTSRMSQLVYLRPALLGASDNIKAARQYEKEIEERCYEIQDIDGQLTFNKEIKIKNIYWKYPNSSAYVLQDASIDIHCGEAIAFIGKSGAGKTTLADILLGLLKPETGEVLVDGINIFAIPHDWCKMVGYVPQTVYIIDDTIRNNVTFGVDICDVDDEKVWQALEQAQLKDYVMALPNKLDTMLGEQGVKFSGGQRQRIAIARALYHNPEILVFDEATAALDGETEQAVMDAIDALQGNKTLIIIAHRINTIRHCDRFFEVKDGKILERTADSIFGGE